MNQAIANSDEASLIDKPDNFFTKLFIKRSKKFYFMAQTVGFLLWSYLLVKLFIFDIDQFLFDTFLPKHVYLLNYKVVFWLVLATLVAATMKLPIFKYFYSYVFVYPFILLFWKPIKFVFKHWEGAVLAFPLVVAFFKKLRLNFIHISLFIISSILILAFDHSVYFTIANQVILGYVVAYITLSTIVFSLKSNPYSKIADIPRAINDKISSSDFELENAATNTDEEQDEQEQERSRAVLLYSMNLFFTWISQKLYAYNKKLFFILYFVCTTIMKVLIVGIAFALIYNSLCSIIPSSFSGASSSSIFLFLGYSFDVLSTSSISHVKAASGLAQVLSYVEFISGLLILSFNALTYFSAKKENDLREIDDFIDELKKIPITIEDKVREIFNLDFEAFELSIVIQEESELKAINFFRKKIGKNELQLAETGE